MLEKLREKARNLPEKPGVYIMLDSSGDVIYVGKAKVLKNRVSSYFHGSHNAKTEALVSKIADFNVIIAGSEFEALVLENSLIKHHMPRYNILLKDDKGYPFVRLDVKSEYPRFSVASKIAEDGARYFGPYGGRSTSFSAIDAVSKALMLPTCSRKFPRDIGKNRPCLNYHMGLCRAYCLKDTPKSEYDDAIKQAIMVFEGRTDALISKLECEMEQAAQDLKFEQAAEKRDRIRALSALKTKQNVLSSSKADTDAVGFFRGATKSSFTVLHYIKGQLLDKDYELIPDPMESDEEALSGLLRQYYAIRGTVAENILLPFEIEDAKSLQQLLADASGKKVTISVPKRGDRKRHVEAALENAKEEAERATTRDERVAKTAQWLKDALNLEALPERIEAYDISNTGSENIVASMTVFYKGRPLKKAYRKFKIRTTDGQDDYHSMQETLTRRIERYLSGDEHFSPLPDLFLIDGGAVHASGIKEVEERLGIEVPVFGMVKDDRHRTRALISPEGQEIGISAFPAVFSFIGSIQEETHRFAIEFNRALRSKKVRKSALDDIPGVGEKRKNDLLKHFKSIKAIKTADIEELKKAVPKNVAQAVYEYFRKEEKGE